MPCLLCSIIFTVVEGEGLFGDKRLLWALASLGDDPVLLVENTHDG